MPRLSGSPKLFSLLMRFLWLQCLVLFAIATTTSQASSISKELQDEVRKNSIIWLKEDVDSASVEQMAKQFAEESGAELTGVYPALKGFGIKLPPPEAADFVAKNKERNPYSAVEAIGADLIVKAYDESDCRDETDPSDHGVPMNIERVVGNLSGSFQSKRVWVIDSGVDIASNQINIDNALATNCVPDGDCSNAGSLDDAVGHGTMVAGIIAATAKAGTSVVGVAPGATVVPVRIFGESGEVELSGPPMKGLNYVIEYFENNAPSGDVVNLSWGAYWFDDLQLFLTTLHRVNKNVRRLAQLGVKIVVAAGQPADESFDPVWVQFVAPAGAGGYDPKVEDPDNTKGGVVLTVSAVKSTKISGGGWADAFWPRSNFGNNPPDYAEPGVEIESLWPGNKVRICSGTSFAAPHLAGILLRGAPRIDGHASGDPTEQGDPNNRDPVGVATQ